MSVAPAVRRLHNDLVRLRRDRKEGDNDHKDLRADTRKLAGDRREGDRDHKALKADGRAHDQAGKVLTRDINARDGQLKSLDQKKQAIVDQLAADTFDHDPVTPGVQQDPALLQQLADATAKRDDAGNTWATKIQTDRDAKAKAGDAVKKDRAEIGQDRKAITHDRKVIKHDNFEIKHDRAVNARARHQALKDLRPAEYKMGLKSTNRVRQELGLDKVNHVIRPMNTNTVQGCAQFLLKSSNVSFWSGLSSGSDRKNMERLARGETAFVPATGGHVVPQLKMMQALVAMAKQGHIQINALTGGTHSTGSNHYSGHAVDLDLSTGNAGMIEAIANRYGGTRNFETDHIHLDF
jgi:hypothetical protein